MGLAWSAAPEAGSVDPQIRRGLAVKGFWIPDHARASGISWVRFVLRPLDRAAHSSVPGDRNSA